MAAAFWVVTRQKLSAGVQIAGLLLMLCRMLCLTQSPRILSPRWLMQNSSPYRAQIVLPECGSSEDLSRVQIASLLLICSVCNHSTQDALPDTVPQMSVFLLVKINHFSLQSTNRAPSHRWALHCRGFRLC